MDAVKLPLNSEQKLIQSDLKISVDGSKLYTLVRGENSLVQYSIDQKSGMLSDPKVLYLGFSRPKGLGIPPNDLINNNWELINHTIIGGTEFFEVIDGRLYGIRFTGTHAYVFHNGMGATNSLKNILKGATIPCKAERQQNS